MGKGVKKRWRGTTPKAKSPSVFPREIRGSGRLTGGEERPPGFHGSTTTVGKTNKGKVGKTVVFTMLKAGTRGSANFTQCWKKTSKVGGISRF